MNAVERLWRALGQRDWASAERQLHPQARISWPHTGEVFRDAEAYVTAIRLNPGIPVIQVERVLFGQARYRDADHGPGQDEYLLRLEPAITGKEVAEAGCKAAHLGENLGSSGVSQ